MVVTLFHYQPANFWKTLWNLKLFIIYIKIKNKTKQSYLRSNAKSSFNKSIYLLYLISMHKKILVKFIFCICGRPYNGFWLKYYLFNLKKKYSLTIIKSKKINERGFLSNLLIEISKFPEDDRNCCLILDYYIKTEIKWDNVNYKYLN